MLNLHPQYVTDAGGQQVVVLPRDEFEQLLEELEIRDDIRAADKAKAKGETPIPLEEALAELDGHTTHKG